MKASKLWMRYTISGPANVCMLCNDSGVIPAGLTCICPAGQHKHMARDGNKWPSPAEVKKADLRRQQKPRRKQ